MLILSSIGLFAQDAATTPVGMPLGMLLGIISAGVFLLLLLLGLKNPQIWVIVSVLAIGGGISAAVYGLTVYNAVDPRLARDVENAAIPLGAGAGAAVAGLILLIVAVLRIRMNAEKRPQNSQP
jgi:membrane associated rhomboid family serine protease